MNKEVQAIRAEIERQKKQQLARNHIGVITGVEYVVDATKLLSFIDSLTEEKPSKDLETEIATWIHTHINGIDSVEWKDRNKTVYITLSAIIGWSGCVARHFAKWGAEHQVIDGNKMIEPSKDLEEEMDKFFETMPVLEHENIFEDTFKNIARHFYEFGHNARKEE